MKLSYEEINYKKFGKCLKVSNGYLEIIATLEIGPRIISFRRLDGENVFWEDVNDEVFVSGEQVDEIFYKGSTWHAYGGHRLWSSPEDYATYYPDNNPVEVIRTDKGIDLIQEKQIATNLQLIMSVTFEEQNLIKVKSRIINLSEQPVKLACWSLSMCKGPGLELIPIPQTVRDFDPQIFYTLWNFGAPHNDRRAYYGDKYFSLRMEPGNPLAFKIGMKVSDGCILYLTGKDALVKRFERIEQAEYPDNNINYETYTKDLFLEQETLGEYKTLQPNEYNSHEEFWSLLELKDEIPTDNNEEVFQSLMDIYCK